LSVRSKLGSSVLILFRPAWPTVPGFVLLGGSETTSRHGPNALVETTARNGKMAREKKKWTKRRVWLKERQNPPKKSGERTVSYTLQWLDDSGQERFESLGTGISREEAESKRAEKEAELNVRKLSVRLEFSDAIPYSFEPSDIVGISPRTVKLPSVVRVELPDLKYEESISTEVPLLITPVVAMQNWNIDEELFRQAVLLSLMEEAVQRLDSIEQQIAAPTDAPEWDAEVLNWKKRLLQMLLHQSTVEEPVPIKVRNRDSLQAFVMPDDSDRLDPQPSVETTWEDESDDFFNEEEDEFPME